MNDESEIQIVKNDGLKNFAFDSIHSEKATQSKMFEKSNIAGLLDTIFDGFTATILAYGQTGSGKTYTLFKEIVGKGREAEEPHSTR